METTTILTPEQKTQMDAILNYCAPNLMKTKKGEVTYEGNLFYTFGNGSFLSMEHITYVLIPGKINFKNKRTYGGTENVIQVVTDGNFNTYWNQLYKAVMDFTKNLTLKIA